MYPYPVTVVVRIEDGCEINAITRAMERRAVEIESEALAAPSRRKAYEKLIDAVWMRERANHLLRAYSAAVRRENAREKGARAMR